MGPNYGLSLAILTLICGPHRITADISGLQDGVANGGKNGNPGVKARITQKGLNYLNDVVKYQMSVLIPRLRIDDMTFNQGLAGSATLTNARVTNYKAPDVQTMNFQPPNQVILVMQNMGVSMSGHVRGNMGLLSDQGDFDGSANNVDVTYVIRILRQPNGQFGIKTQSCKANVGDCDVNLYNTGPLGNMLNAMKGLMINSMRPQMGKQICTQGTKYFDEAANLQLARIPTKVWLNETDPETMAHRILHGGSGGGSGSGSGGRRSGEHGDHGQHKGWSTRRPQEKRSGSGHGDEDEGEENAHKMQEMSKNVTKHLMLDYTNIKDPIVTKDKAFLETYNKGEVSYHGQGGTPFFPNNLQEPTPYPTDRMGYVVASDYVANSLLHQAFTHGLIKYRINPDETPDLAQYMRTSCDSDFLTGDMCLGSIIPQIQDSFPDSVAEVYVEANKVAPAVFFQKDGLVKLQAPVTITLNAKKGSEKKLMAIGDMDVSARGKLYVERQRIKGNVTIDKADLKMRENNIKGFDQKGVNELAASAKNIMGVMANMYLKQGLPLPIIRGAKLINTVVNVYDRTIRIDTDCQVDQAVLSRMAAKAIRENSNGARVEGIDDSGAS